ncbi:hypothetical protein ABIB25_000377 [Nakamurella sp. UYEF19]|uniref:hypothetical protein n=1 Tax=Nakamurella sp. UYEF19 TaxID=1756392 RepID=UPI00339B97B8
MPLRGRRLTMVLTAALVAVLVLGGASALAISAHRSGVEGSAGAGATNASSSPGDSSAAVTGPGVAAAVSPAKSGSDGSEPSSPSPSSGTSVAGPGATTSNSSTGPAPSADPQAGGSSPDPTSAPAGPSNNLTVQMSPSSRAHPRAQDVQLLLQGFFDAINQHNYVSWTQSVTGAMESRQTSEAWLQAYATTVDSSIWMESMRDDPLQVTLRFTSQQDVDLAPKDLQAACIDWTLTYQLAAENGRLVVGSTVPGSVVMAKCAG